MQTPLSIQAVRILLAAALLAGCSNDESSGENRSTTTPEDGSTGGSADSGGIPQSDAGGLPTAPGAASDWTRAAYDLASTYNNTGETLLSRDNAAQLTEVWTLEAGGQITGAPAVVGDRVYVVSQGTTYALDLAGAETWSVPIGGSSAPAFDEGTLYVFDRDAVLHALDASNGAELWQAVVDPHPSASGFSAPIVADRYVIVGNSSGEEGSASMNATFRGGVVAYDKTDGTELWRHHTAEEPINGCAVWSTISVDLEMGRVFATTGNNYTEQASDRSDSIFALDITNGNLIWNMQAYAGDVFTVVNPNGSPDNDFGANPILFEAMIDGQPRQLVGAGQKSGTFWALDRESGDVVWSRSLSGSNALLGGMLNNGAFDGQRILVAANTATSTAPGSEPSNMEGPGGNVSVLFALDAATGNIVWERQLPAPVWAPITVANGVGFVGYEKHMQAFNTETGEKLFVFDVTGTIACAASVSGGRVYFGSGLTYFVGAPGRTLHVLGVP